MRVPAAYRPAEAQPSLNLLGNGSVVVPADFVGVHLGNWPVYRPSQGPDPAPPFGMSWTRAQSHVYANGESDAGPLVWSKLHTAPGVYAWQTNPQIDLLFDGLQAAGYKMVFDLQSTPDWASSGVVMDPWGSVGGNVAPDNLTHLYDFLVALLTRYGSVIRAVEVWNEPTYGTPTGFFIGTAASMVDVAATVKSAVNAVDSSIDIIAPCYHLEAFLAAGGGAHVEAISMHSYGQFVDPTVGPGLVAYALTQKGVAARYGFEGLPLWETERGFAADTQSAAALIAQRGGQEWAAAETKRILAVEAALGVRACLLYSYTTGLHGDMRSSAAMHEAIDWAHQVLSGSTLTGCTLLADGRIEIVADGTVYLL